MPRKKPPDNANAQLPAQLSIARQPGSRPRQQKPKGHPTEQEPRTSPALLTSIERLALIVHGIEWLIGELAVEATESGRGREAHAALVLRWAHWEAREALDILRRPP